MQEQNTNCISASDSLQMILSLRALLLWAIPVPTILPLVNEIYECINCLLPSSYIIETSTARVIHIYSRMSGNWDPQERLSRFENLYKYAPAYIFSFIPYMYYQYCRHSLYYYDTPPDNLIGNCEETKYVFTYCINNPF